MTTEQIIILVLGIVIAALVAALIVLLIKYKGAKRAADGSHAAEVYMKDGVRYTKNTAIERAGEAAITHAEGDFVLATGKTYRAKKGGELAPGAYTVLAANESAQAFKLRVGGYVRNFVHGDALVLHENEEICAVSVPVILR